MVEAETVIAVTAVLGLVAGALKWINEKRWKGVDSSRERERYLREQLVDVQYGGGKLPGVVTDVRVTENAGTVYKIKKHTFAKVTGYTEFTMRFRAGISEDRLNKEPFTTLFSDPSEKGLVDAEHLWTKPDKQQQLTLIRIRVYSTDYNEVGSWCSALPKQIWKAHQMQHQM